MLEVFGIGLNASYKRGPQTEMWIVTAGHPGLVAVGCEGPGLAKINGEFVELPIQHTWWNAAAWTSPTG